MRVSFLAAPAFAGCLAVLVFQVQPSPLKARPQPIAQQARQSVPASPLLTGPQYAPERLFPAPPARDSLVEKLEFQRIRALHDGVPRARLERAARDGHDERPDAFNAAAGVDLAQLPATTALLVKIQDETDRIVENAKSHFRRMRPYAVDPKIAHCGNSRKLYNSYPSGHAGFAWSVGWALARLLPDRAPQIIARAQDYALGREICAVHFPSDVEASHAAAVLIADRLLSDPRMHQMVVAARRELSNHHIVKSSKRGK